MKCTAWFALLATSFALMTASVLHAETSPIFGDPSHVAVELRFGAYRPNVDSAFNNAAPYRSTFGDDRRYMVSIEVDWQALRFPYLGTLGLGISAGYTSATGRAKFADDGTDSIEETSFTVWPIALLAVARIDVLAREYMIPIVPYVKIGPAFALWYTGNEHQGTAQSADGKIGRGRTNGWVLALGGMLLLNPLEPQAARKFLNEQGIKRSYAFAEFTMNELNGIGQNGAMRVGNRTWNVGLAFEF